MNGKEFLAATSPGELLRGSRSTALHPLSWMTAILISGLVSGVWVGLPQWLLIVFATGLVLTYGVFLFSYIHFMRTDKDALRSENYAIQKLQIERNAVGDSETGFRKTIEGKATSNPSLNVEDAR